MIDRRHYKLGKRPAVSRPTLGLLQRYAQKLPDAPERIDWTVNVPKYAMFSNDVLGDCTIASMGHFIQTWTSLTGGELILPDEEIRRVYSVACGWNPKNSDETDQGGVETDVLAWWKKFPIGHTQITAFSVIDPYDVETLKRAIWILGGAYVGWELPVSIRSAETWDVPKDASGDDWEPGGWGGHATGIFGYDKNGVILASWDEKIHATWAFVERYMSESYGVLSREWVAKSDLAPSKFNFAQMQADMPDF